MSKTVFILMALSLLGACTLVRQDLAWPEDAYPRSYFEAAFQEDEMAQEYQSEEDYLLWITRFYNGYSIAPGWLQLTDQVMERLEGQDPAWRAEVNERLYHLGGRIGSEWAKHNDVRMLDTRNAAVWRDALIESISQGDIDNYITRVENDVESLMMGELEKEDIQFERYYEDDFEF